MEQLSPVIDSLQDHLAPWLATAQDWATSPAAWSQFVLLGMAWVMAHLLGRRFRTQLSALIIPPEGASGPFAMIRRWSLLLLPLLVPLLAYGLTAVGEAFTRSLFGSGAVIAFGKRVFLFMAARAFAQDILREPFLRLLGRYVLVPAAALYALGALGPIVAWLESLTIELGNIHFSVMALIRGVIAGSLLFWMGTWSNRQSASYIKAQQGLRPATRELAAKATEIGIFGAAFLLLMSIMGINLTAVAVLGGALGVGVGLGLQQIAANFVSGIILLIEGQTTVGDYVELDGGEKGTIVRMTARACILETFDGKWIVVPNEHFITSRVVNYSDQGSANRYEVSFQVAYETDLERVANVVVPAVAALPFVLKAPEGPDCELAGFGESGVDFSLEYWVNGIDDGKNKYASQVRMEVWRALTAAGIAMPYPHRVVEIRGTLPA
ncbi:mechanosensitive ion channel [Sedimentimonas flavescens]|uniref:Mechanosensitive ion channel n=1 Tax=Sedimentimonas flavescens TaxID=2851012 RepID=A0ABT2ZZK1_9RHOB|nr:mechanosensitive ion channel domain-containing protein [Sedimentimonas flavescens]MCV2879176.1 mechanosensitive ion channel [Sedimentimonas flavescens]